MDFSFKQPNKSRDVTLIFLIVLGVLLFRRFDAFTNPQLWAEDYPIFFFQYSQMGLKSLITPYAGYMHFVPRLIAILFGALRVNYLYIPLCYNYSAFLITFFIALNTWRTSSSLNIKHRIFYATSFLFLPVASDIFMNITNIIWITGLYQVNFLFTRNDNNTGKWWYLNLVVIFIISLTGPFSALLSPLVLVIMLLERKELTLKKILPLSLILIGGVIQVISIKFLDPNFYRGQPGPPEQYHLLRLITNNMSEMLFLKYDFMRWLSPSIAMVVSLLSFMVFSYVFIRGYIKTDNKRKYILLVYAIIVLAAFIKAYWPNESKVLALDNARYYFIPFACIGWLIILSFDKTIKPAYIGVYLIFFIAHHRSIRMSFTDKHWKTQILEYYDGKRQEIDVNPDGWHFALPDKK